MGAPVDLDHLERLHAEKLKGIEATTWGDEDGEYEAAVVRVFDVSSFSETEDIGDGTAYEYAGAAAQETADAAVEVCNALPALIAEVRALREVADAAHEALEMDQPGMTNLRDHARDVLRTALAKVPR
jgi:hypothetical protein